MVEGRRKKQHAFPTLTSQRETLNFRFDTVSFEVLHTSIDGEIIQVFIENGKFGSFVYYYIIIIIITIIGSAHSYETWVLLASPRTQL